MSYPYLDINKQNYEGSTALMFAVGRERLECVELFLNVPGIDLDIESDPEPELPDGWFRTSPSYKTARKMAE